jgi:hypothetical protein
MMTTGERRERLVAERVTEGLSAEGEAELTLLLGEDPATSDEVRQWEMAAAAVAQAFVGARATAEIPPSVARRLTEEAEIFVAAASRSSRKAAGADWMTTGAASATEMPSVRPPAASPSRIPIAWWAAAAALLLCAGQTWRLHEAARPGGGASAAARGGEVVQALCTSDSGGRPASLSWDARARTGTIVVSPTPSSSDAPGANLRTGGGGAGPVVYRCEAALP